MEIGSIGEAYLYLFREAYFNHISFFTSQSIFQPYFSFYFLIDIPSELK
jgi:hypothetical protein